MFLGRNVKEYVEKSTEIIERHLGGGNIKCVKCLLPMARHSSYARKVKETGDRIEITVVWCRKCESWHALQPDFLLPNKHYGGNEIESVIIEGATEPVSRIDTAASESTVRRWLEQVGASVTRAVGVLKYMFGRARRAVNEAAIDPGPPYSELEQVLEMAPRALKCSGNKLGLANMWLGAGKVPAYI